ncbi:hypothetical protein Ancab_026307 [Ancistrocladus abbreviatus]
MIFSNSSYFKISYFFSSTHIPQIESPNLFLHSPPTILFTSSVHLQNPLLAKRCLVSETLGSFRSNNRWLIKVYDSNGFVQDNEGVSRLNVDGFLSFVELTCLASSLAISVGYLVKWAFFSQLELKSLMSLANRVLVWLLAGAVAVGTVIRRRQWRRVCGFSSKSEVESGEILAERIEKLEENLRSATTIIRMLSRQLEKLGVRFRIARKTLKEPISETAALAQKNSEAARALALQEDILEKELAEVQKVILAMQDQQQKQLELILAIVKNGKLYDTKRVPDGGALHMGHKNQTDEALKPVDSRQVQAVAGQKGGNNDKA